MHWKESQGCWVWLGWNQVTRQGWVVWHWSQSDQLWRRPSNCFFSVCSVWPFLKTAQTANKLQIIAKQTQTASTICGQAICSKTKWQVVHLPSCEMDVEFNVCYWIQSRKLDGAWGGLKVVNLRINEMNAQWFGDKKLQVWHLFSSIIFQLSLSINLHFMGRTKTKSLFTHHFQIRGFVCFGRGLFTVCMGELVGRV